MAEQVIAISQERDPSPTSVARKPTSLMPREHGAYGQLAMPLLAAFVASGASVRGVAVVAAVVCAFLAHEPLLVWKGQRGPRARREDGPRALRRLGTLSVVGLLSMLVAAVPERRAELFSLAPLMLLGLPIAWLLYLGREKSLVGELLVASALTSVVLPVMVAGGTAPPAALAVWGAFAVGFGASTAAVRAVMHSHKREPTLADDVALVVIGAGVLAALSPHARPVIAAAPLVVAAIGTRLAAPHPRNLRRVGWALVAASVVSTLIVVQTLRG